MRGMRKVMNRQMSLDCLTSIVRLRDSEISAEPYEIENRDHSGYPLMRKEEMYKENLGIGICMIHTVMKHSHPWTEYQ